jgi:diacylglycerol kinase family enzyme
MRAEIGLTADMNVETSRDMKDKLGPLAYGVGAVLAVQKATRAQFNMLIDGERVDVTGVSVQVLNTTRMGSATRTTYARSVSPYDGLLDVVVADASPLGIVSAIDRALKVDDQWGISHWQGREVTVESDPVKPMWCDGEPFGDTPKVIRIVPGAVRILTLPEGQSSAAPAAG